VICNDPVKLLFCHIGIAIYFIPVTMSKTTPFIGSKISLISKAEIRYEGTLYQVDADNSTVTLAKGTDHFSLF